MSRDAENDTSFGSWLGRGTVSDYYDALNRYKDGFPDAFLLKRLPIVPDTNVLLNHMHLPEGLAEKARDFFAANSGRVILANQVSLEYERHRYDPAYLDHSAFKQLPPLGEDREDCLRQEFGRLAAKIDTARLKAELASPYKAIPGLADVKKKPERAHGDYLILHEMMAFARTADTDVVFLTRDVDKGDWLTPRRQAYPHMVETVHVATGHCVFVVDAPTAFATIFSDTDVPVPQPFSDFVAYRTRFMIMWERLKEVVALQGHDVPAATRKRMSDLRRIRNVLVQNVRVSDAMLDRNTLLMMEGMFDGMRLTGE